MGTAVRSLSSLGRRDTKRDFSLPLSSVDSLSDGTPRLSAEASVS